MNTLSIHSFFWNLFFALFLEVTVAQGGQYYIDFQAGNDTNSGTSSGAAWKTIPGTRNPANTADVATRWGTTFSSTLKVPAGTVFKLKSGTICGTNNGCGMVNVSSAYYSTGATFANSILFQRDPTWGSGSVVFDGNGVTLGSGTGWGLLHVTVGGISFDGVVGVSDLYDGIIVKNSDRIGISYYANSLTEGGTVQFVKFFACGKIYNATSTTASEGHLFVKYHRNGMVNTCMFDGNGNYHNGFAVSSDNRVTDYTVSNCVAKSMTGSDVLDCGIGFKAQNSVVTWINCTSYNNDKGFDLGENGGDSSFPINYKLIGCLSCSNQFGINLSGPDPGVQWPAGITFSLINCVVYGNVQIGSKIYAGPYNLYMVHNVYDGNDTNLKVGPDGLDDGVKPINAYLYNNVFYKGISMNILGGAWGGTPALSYTLNADYNSYIQRASEYFCRWSYWNTMPPSGVNKYDFSYGANGPGHASGYWYNFYGANATDQPTNGCTGHYHCDAHSKGTGATDLTLPPFANVTGHDYRLTANYAGVNLSQFPWYVPEMGVDRAGVTRTAWDIGVFESAATTTAASILVTPGSQSFGSITVGTTTDRTFTVQNTGGGTLSGSASVAAPFSVVAGSSYSLGAGLSQIVTVRYSPTTSGPNSQSVSFTGGAGASAPLSGTAAILPAISVTPGSQSFGPITVGTTTDRTFTVQNTGGGTLSGSASVAAPFSVVAGSSYSLGAGLSQIVTVRYSPTTSGTNAQSVSFTGGAGASAPVSGTAAILPAISVTPGSQGFGSINVGMTADRTFAVQNTGGGTLSGSANVAAPFSVVAGGSYSLGAGQSQAVTVRYYPAIAGTNIQTVTFTGGGGASATVNGAAWVPPIVSAITQSVADVDTNTPGLQVFAGSVIQYSGTASDAIGNPIIWQWICSVNDGAETVLQSGTGAVNSISYYYTENTVSNTYIWKLRVSNGQTVVESNLTVGVISPSVAVTQLSFPAISGAISAPFGTVTNSYIFQQLETVDPATAGRAAYTFAIIFEGDYIIQGIVNASSEVANSFLVNIDAEPQYPTMIWDIPVTMGFERRVVSWRGNGTFNNNQFVPKIFTLSQGIHQLIIRGSEANVKLERINIVSLPSAPGNLRILPQP
ncbi:MAG: choice-of-anchor D domain-containing protein [bacterium]